MSFNILDLVKDQLGSQLGGHASKYLGESEGVTGKAMEALLPTILGSIASKGSSKAGVEDLLGSVSKLDGGMLDNIGDIFGGGSSSIDKVLKFGGPILSLLFGNKMGALGSLISNFSGMKSSSSSTLMKLAVPFILNIVGKKIKGLGVGDIVDLFKGQSANINAGLPKGFDVSSLGIGSGNIMDKAEDLVEDAAGAALDAGKKGSSFLRWLLPAFVVLMGLAYFFGFKTGCGAVDNTVAKANDLTENVVETTASTAGDLAEGAVDLAKGAVSLTGDALGAVFSVVDEAAKKTLDGISFVTGSAGYQLKSFIEGGFSGDNKFKFTNLTFDSGSATIGGESGVEVDNIAAILKAYPNVKLAIEGYTDNTGNADANVTLSQQRAESVKARLVAGGVADSRIVTSGYGAANPVASNDNAEGRAANRRIELRIVQ